VVTSSTETNATDPISLTDEKERQAPMPPLTMGGERDGFLQHLNPNGRRFPQTGNEIAAPAAA
jgi:hypothetical protein